MNNSALFSSRSCARPDIEPVLPLINIVFLLLIFFLMTGKLQKPEVKTISPPKQLEEKTGISIDPEYWLYLMPNGDVLFRNEPVNSYERVKTELNGNQLTVFADAKLTGEHLDKILLPLKKVGIESIALVSERTAS